MSKVNLKIRLIGPEENLNLKVSGIKVKNKIIYKENSITVSISIKDETLTINRMCNEYQINLNFNKYEKTNSNYTMFGSNKKFYLETITKKLEISDNKIDINYNLEGNDFIFSLEVI